MPASQQPPSDGDLIASIARGERDAFGALYDRHASTMMALACRILNDHREAEDLLHDVFLEVWNKAHAYRPERASVRTWLMLRLRSRALDRLRSSRISRTVALDDSTPRRVSRDDPSQGADHATLRSALDQLPPEQRRVLELGYFRGLSSSEIAAEVNIPVGTVKSRTAAGLAKLRAGLREG